LNYKNKKFGIFDYILTSSFWNFLLTNSTHARILSFSKEVISSPLMEVWDCERMVMKKLKKHVKTK